MMENAIAAGIATLIASAPNIVVAVWVIIRQDKRIDDLLTAQKWLIEQLMAMHPPQPPPGTGAAAPPSERLT